MKKTTREWAKKAEQDYVLARQGTRSTVPVHDGVCFHCQQCAEKYLKGMMEEIGLPVPKTHYLDLLLTALAPQHPALRTLRRGLLFLTVFAVETRYPGSNASKRQAVAALRWALGGSVTHGSAGVIGHPRTPSDKVTPCSLPDENPSEDGGVLRP